MNNSKEKWSQWSHSKHTVYIVGKRDVQFLVLKDKANKRGTSSLHSNRFGDEK